MAPQYGEVRVDYITYTTGVVPNEGNATAYVSGLINNPTFSGNVVVEGNAAIDGTLNVSGDVGIGTDSPNSRLHVRNATADCDVIIQSTDGTNAGKAVIRKVANDDSLVIAASRGTGNRDIAFNTAIAEPRMTIKSGGSVGIGTTTPEQLLHVSGSQGTPVRVESSTTTSQIQFKTSNGSNLYIGSEGVNNFVVKNKPGSGSTTEKFRITGDGNVGIATTDPQALLDVAGRILAGPNTSGGLISAPNLQGTDISAQIQVNSSGDGSPSISLNHARSNSIGSSCFAFNKAHGNFTTPTVVPNNAVVGSLVFNGYDGSKYLGAAQISAEIDNVTGTDDMPGRLQFLTTANGASSPTERMRIDSTGNVGIGTDDPQVKLDIRTDAGTPCSISVNEGTTTNPLSITQSSTEARIQTSATQPLVIAGQSGSGSTSSITFETRGATRAVIAADGDVGIGTDDPQDILSVGRDSTADQRISLFSKADNSQDNYGSIVFRYNQSNGNKNAKISALRETNSSSGALVFYTRTASDAENNDGGEERLRISSTGNVGIGTTNPQAKLAVIGAITSSATVTGLNGSFGNFTLSGNNLTGTAQVNITAGGSGRMTFRTKGSNDEYRFFNASETYYGELRFKGFSANRFYTFPDAGGTIALTDDITGNYLSLASDAGDQTVLSTDDTNFSGNVGIRTTTPQASLHVVKSNLKEIARFERTNSGNVAHAFFVGPASTTTVSAGCYQNDFTVELNNSEKFRVKSDGNVGIGTDNPQNKLHVVDSFSTGIRSQSENTQSTDTNKALHVSNGDTTDTFNVSYKGQGYFAGNVGIGTDDPSEILEVVGSGGPTLQVRSTSNTAASLALDSDRGSSVISGQLLGKWNDKTYAAIRFITGDDAVNKDNGHITFATSDTGNVTERLRITDTGNLGIGTTDPQDPLDVNGAGIIGGMRLDGGVISAQTTNLVLQTDATNKNISFKGKGNNSDYKFFHSTNGKAAIIRLKDITQNRTYLLPNAGGTFVLAENSTGVISASGIQFPAATSNTPGLNAVVDSNLLDDYEEGTFTPELNGGTATNIVYNSPVGKYVKIGKVVHIQINLKITSGTLSTDGSNFAIKVPFVSVNETNVTSVFSIGRNNMLTGFTNGLGARITKNTTNISFANGFTIISNTASGISLANTQIEIAGTYVIN